MDLSLIIAEIRGRCPAFAGRVGGAAQFKDLTEISNLRVPAAFVIPLDDEPGQQRSQTGYQQDLVDAFAVIVMLSNEPDERGQGSVTQAINPIRAELWRCLLGWEPAEGYEGVFYQGGALLKLDRSRLYYQFDFAAECEITAAQTRLTADVEALPPFEGADFGVDLIDPSAVPPAPDGVIEFQFKFDPPQT